MKILDTDKNLRLKLIFFAVMFCTVIGIQFIRFETIYDFFKEYSKDGIIKDKTVKLFEIRYISYQNIILYISILFSVLLLFYNKLLSRIDKIIY